MRFPVWAVAAALLVKAFLALTTTGTNDAVTWTHDLSTLRANGPANLYREGVQYASPSGALYQRQLFIHPPGVVSGLYGLGILQDVSGLPLTFWMRMLCALADIGTLAVVWRLFRRTGTTGLMTLLALSPISILVSGFHVNTDPIMTFFVALTVFLVERKRAGWAAVAFGLATSIKLVPLIYLPATILYLPRNTARAKWAAIAGATWVAVAMPWLAQYPGLILRTILGYSGATGAWGFYFLTGLLKLMGRVGVHDLYGPVAKWIALLAVTLLPFVFKALVPRPSLFVQFGAITFLFLFLSPGFGLQYLAWTVPWIVALGIGPAAGYYAIAGTFLLAVYTEAAGGWKANAYADLLTVKNHTMLLLMGLVCWSAMGAILWSYARLTLKGHCSGRASGGA
jgi:uncharacterized membrane protein